MSSPLLNFVIMNRRYFLFLLLLLNSCVTTHRFVDFQEFTTLKQYPSTEVLITSNGTGKKLNLQFLKDISNGLSEELNRLGYKASFGATDQPYALIIKPRLTSFSRETLGGFGAEGKPSLPGSINCTLATTFIEKQSGKKIGEIIIGVKGLGSKKSLKKAILLTVQEINNKTTTEEEIPQFMVMLTDPKEIEKIEISQKTNIAVLEFEAREVPKIYASTISELLRTEIVNMRICNVVERQRIDKVLAEYKLQASGITSAENTTKIGKMLNAQKVIVGSISKIFDTYYITANMVDVESGKIESASSADCSNVGEFNSIMKKVGSKLFKQ